MISVWGKPGVIISGGARGADAMAERWAKEHGIPLTVFKADWKLGTNAGPRRNRDIMKLATHVLAFPSNEGRGTQHALSLIEGDDTIFKHIVWID